MAARLKAAGAGAGKYRNGFAVTCHEDELVRPLLWRKHRRMVFVCSMADLFHEDVPDKFIADVMDVIRRTCMYTYQLLTKRPERMNRFFELYDDFRSRFRFSFEVEYRRVPLNVWLGTTVENAAARGRLDSLRATACAPLRFASFEPLLGDPGKLDLSRIGWVICGGETGPKARRMEPDWARSVRDQAKAAGIPFFFKAWGAWGPDGVRRPKRENGAELDGRIWRETPGR
jgi:protein gp37